TMPPNAYPSTTSWTTGNRIEMTIRVGLRRNRRSSRSTIAHMRCMALPARHHERALARRRLVGGVAEAPTSVVNEDVVQRRALHGGRVHRHTGPLRRLHEGECRDRPVG